MELILISESKLKIMLTADDMENYAISSESLSYERKDTRKMFDRILNEAKEKTGFDSTASKLFIQVYPSKNGGCEVYVTRDPEDICQTGRNDRKTVSKDKTTTPKKKKEYCVYLFEGLKDAVSACSVLKRSGYKNESVMYVEERGTSSRYFLVLQEEVSQNTQNRKRKALSKSDLANEYGKRLGGKEIVFYINEHARIIIENNAVEKVSALK